MVAARPYDPFSPHAPAFPRARLLRAGVVPELVDNLAGQYAELGYGEQVEFTKSVNRAPDEVIAERFTAAAAQRLEDLNVAQLKDLLSAKSLPVSGTKPELIDRLNSAGVTAPPVEAPPIAPVTPVEQPPAVETPATPPATPEQPATPDAPAAPAETPATAPTPPEGQPATPAPTDTATTPPQEAAQPPADAPAAAPAADAPASAPADAPAPADAAPAPADAPAPTTPPAAGDGTTPTTGA